MPIILSMSVKSIVNWIRQEKRGLIILGLAWAVFFGRVYATGNIFFLDDLKIIYYPLEHAYAEFQSDFSLPLWSNEFGFGHPLLAWGQLGFFTPLHVLLRLFQIHPITLLQISIASYFLIGLIGMFAFLRYRSFSQPAAILGASLFTWNGFSIGHLNHVNFYTGTMLLPILLWAIYAFLIKPSYKKAILLALVVSAITLSAQPQVVLFIVIVSAAYGIGYVTQLRFTWKQYVQRASFLILAGGIAFALSSFSILPLFEFIPETERSTPLPRTELLEFSYVPNHAITLLLPYFYGDHDTYWGAKGFQELAAFVGLIPLVLAGSALASIKRLKIEGKVGFVLVAIALLFATGKYSPLYSFLVQQQFITSFGVASRFVFFFVMGITFLAPSTLDLIPKIHIQRSKIHSALFGFLFPVLLLFPFFLSLSHKTPQTRQLAALIRTFDMQLLLVSGTAGVLLIVGFFWIRVRQLKTISSISLGLAILTVITLLIYSWNYNPITPATQAYALSPFQDNLESYKDEKGIPPRLYSRQELVRITPHDSVPKKISDPISELFAIYQPIPLNGSETGCFLVPLRPAGDHTLNDVVVALHTNPRIAPVSSHVVPAYRITGSGPQTICFDATLFVNRPIIWLSITSGQESGVVLPFAEQKNATRQAYFTRKKELTDSEWERSQKPYTVPIKAQQNTQYDEEAVLLARHIQVATGTSSARWIGALSIREYRNFIEQFFANDQEPLDGDNIHAIIKYRTLLNLAGITHLAQTLPDPTQDAMESQRFTIVNETPTGNETARLYTNPEVFPKAFMVPGAIWKAAADETRYAMSSPDFNPKKTVYLSGTKPPDVLFSSDRELSYSTNIIRYTPTQVDIQVTTNTPGYLLVTDSTTPQWQTYVDNNLSDYLVGDSIFKTAEVPAGDHLVSFRYNSPATTRATWLTVIGLIMSVGLLLAPEQWWKRSLRSNQ